MSLLTIRNEVKKAIGDRTDLDSVINDQINFAMEEFARTLKAPDLFVTATTPTVDAVGSYLLPADCYAPLAVTVYKTSDNNLDRRELDEDTSFEYDRILSTATKGIPTRWARWNNLLYIYSPVPDSTARTLQLRYWKRLARLSADSDNTVFANEYERGLRLLATKFMLRILGRHPDAAEIQNEYLDWLSRFQLPLGIQDEYDNSAQFMPVVSRGL